MALAKAPLVVLGATFLVASGLDLAAQTTRDVRLVEAVKLQDADAVRAIVLGAAGDGVDVNAAQADGATALHWAAYLDDLRSAELLLGAGADASAANTYGVTPLALACRNANAAMVDALLPVLGEGRLVLDGEYCLHWGSFVECQQY